MLGTLLVILIPIVLLTAGGIFAVERVLRYPNRGVMNVSEFLRPANPKKFMILLNPEYERRLRAAVSRRGFFHQQRKNLHSALEFLLSMRRNTRVCIELSNYELRRELKDRPGMEESELYVEAATNLQQAAIEFRAYCSAAIGKAVIWLIFRTHWWLPFGPPSILTLRQVRGLNFLAAYNKFVQALSDLGALHGPEFQEAFMRALTRTDPIDEILHR